MSGIPKPPPFGRVRGAQSETGKRSLVKGSLLMQLLKYQRTTSVVPGRKARNRSESVLDSPAVHRFGASVIAGPAPLFPGARTTRFPISMLPQNTLDLLF